MRPVLVFTQGDPAGIGPEILLKLLASPPEAEWIALVVAEQDALEAHTVALQGLRAERFVELEAPVSRADIDRLSNGVVALLQPATERRTIEPGHPSPADARAALAALDLGRELVTSGVGDALVTAPISKEQVAQHCRADFRGHTDYLAQASGLERYGRDYLMCFLSDDLRVALLSTHLPLRDAIAQLDEAQIGAALDCLQAHVGGRIAVAGLNPHAGEGGLLGSEEHLIIAPAVAAARRRGADVSGPLSADSLFARARRGEFDWVLALYHDQGLIAVKTIAFGSACNWTLGLPYVRTSVDHGTAYAIAGQGVADVEPLRAVVRRTLELLTSSSTAR